MSCNISSEMATWTPAGDQNPMVGYRFHPTDRDLIIDYLEPKLKGLEGDDPIIGVADVYKIEPWDLPVHSKIESKGEVWYFFCSRDQKFRKSKRSTEKGYWKYDGKPGPIKATRTQKVIGTKRTLIFRTVPSKGIRTKWVMQEYECIPELKVDQQILQGMQIFAFPLRDSWGQSVGEVAIGFALKDAVLFPREAEKGIWPENYSLSDHARLTVVFAPVRMQCSN